MGTDILALNLLRIRELKINTAAFVVVSRMLKDELDGFWIHLDADVLEDRIMPAVDYRIEGGLDFSELGELLRVLVSSRRGAGMSVTILTLILIQMDLLQKTLYRAWLLVCHDEKKRHCLTTRNMNLDEQTR
jgi:hypothetical protein